MAVAWLQVWEHAAPMFHVFCGAGIAMGPFSAGLVARIAGIAGFDARIKLVVSVCPRYRMGLLLNCVFVH